MFYNAIVHFEVLAYTKSNDRPCYMEKFRNQDNARRCGRSMKGRYFRVEVNAVYVDSNDANNVLSAELISAWEDGKQTA